MGRVEDLVPTIEINEADETRIISPQVRKFYQKNGMWYAVVEFMVGSAQTSMHVALGVN